MGSSFSPNPECWKLRTLYSPCDSWKRPRVVSSLPLRKNNIIPCGLVNVFGFSSPKYMKVQRVKHVCSSKFDDFHNEEMIGKEILEPSLLGIKPEPPIWPEREEILRLTFERKVNSVGIPLSIRMIKKKLQLEKEEGFRFKDDAIELLMTQCSVKKTFSSMLFILHELQNHALQSREILCSEELKSAIAQLQREMDASFVWLFQQVFFETPNLMVEVMVFLANFSVFSMSKNNNNVQDVPPSSMINVVQPQQHSQVGVDVVDQGEYVKKELTEEEERLWNSMLEEASKLQKQWWSEDLDHEIVRMFVAPVSVELEGDHQYEEYLQTELYYKKNLSLSPYNSLLLSNYAQFLFLVLHDIDRAEEYYKRSVLVESPEAEAFSRYADFLYRVRKDIWAAELRYLQAVEAEPNNTYILSKYANFLWNTGGTENSSFPVRELDNMEI